MYILEELWYGNIQFRQESIDKDSDYARALHALVEEKSQLSPQVRSAIEGLLDRQLEVSILAERDAFVSGYRLASQILIEALKNR